MVLRHRAALRQQGTIDGLPLEGGTLQWLIDRELGAEHVMSYRLTINPQSNQTHVHIGAEEVLYVLRGRGEIQVEGARHAVAEGRAVYIPDGAEHSYISSGDGALVLVGAMAPLIAPDDIHPAMPRLDLSSARSACVDEAGVTPRMMDERTVTPTLMGERSFRVLVSPAVGCQRMTQFTGVIPTGRAPLHAHPHEEAIYILAGTGRLWIEEDPVGELKPGSVVFFSIGVRHTLENTGREDMKVLGAFSPAGSPEAKLPPAH
jgi:quercetin dioxygenase-like cupin family protein